MRHGRLDCVDAHPLFFHLAKALGLGFPNQLRRQREICRLQHQPGGSSTRDGRRSVSCGRWSVFATAESDAAGAATSPAGAGERTGAGISGSVQRAGASQRAGAAGADHLPGGGQLYS